MIAMKVIQKLFVFIVVALVLNVSAQNKSNIVGKTIIQKFSIQGDITFRVVSSDSICDSNNVISLRHFCADLSTHRDSPKWWEMETKSQRKGYLAPAYQLTKMSKKEWNDNLFSSFVETPLNGSDTIISMSLNYCVSKDLSKIALVDFNTSYVLLYEKGPGVQGYSLKDVIKPIKEEFAMFVAADVPTEILNFVIDINSVNIIYLDVAFSTDNRQLMITASLPRLYWENIATESLAYFNQPCIIKYDLETKKREYVQLKDCDVNYASHSNAFFSEDATKLLLPIKKGWPVEGVSDSPPSDAVNPFLDTFYKDAYCLAEYDASNGSFVRSLRQLPEKHRQTKTGYFYSRPIVSYNGDKALLLDAGSGDAVIYDLADKSITPCCNVFDKSFLPEYHQNSSYVSQKNAKKDLDKIMAAKDEFPIRVIYAVVANDKLYVAITDEENILLKVIDIKGKRLFDTKILPIRYNDMNMRKLKLTKSLDGVELVLLADELEKVVFCSVKL